MAQGVKRFGNYFLLKKIAAGGMAELYKGKKSGEKGFEKLLAIKMILPHLAASDEFVSMFIDEAKVAALLNHQNIVQIYDLGRIEDSYCIVMEYVRGKDLRTVISRGIASGNRMSAEHACLITANALAGLSYAHRKRDKGEELSIVHRDISPQNILISYEGEIKIVDFGIAKAATQSRDTQAGVLKGKLAYMSPEQALGKPLDMRSDVFSTGIVLYEALTGRKLFQGDTDIATLELVRAAKVDPLPTSLDGEFPKKLEDIVLKALAKEPEDRYQSAAEMESVLLEFMRSAGYATSGYSLSEYMYSLFRADIEQEIMEERELDQTIVADALTVDTLAGPVANSGAQAAPAPAPAAPSITPAPQAAPEARGGKSSLAVVLASVALVAGIGVWAGSKFMSKADTPDTPPAVTEAAQPGAAAQPAPVAAAPSPAPDSRNTKTASANPAPAAPAAKAAPAAPASATISSEPPGASVSVDGRSSGRTPLNIAGLAPDRPHKVVMSMAGYRDWSDSFTAGPGENASVHASLAEITATVHVSTTPPGAKILLDGRDTGKTTPADIDGLKPGVSYRVKTVMAGFAPYEEPVSVKPGGRVSVEAVLARQYGVLNVNATPWANVVVDDEPKGATPLANVKLTAGEHLLVLENPKLGLKKKIKVKIKPDETTRVVIDLAK